MAYKDISTVERLDRPSAYYTSRVSIIFFVERTVD